MLVHNNSESDNDFLHGLCASAMPGSDIPSVSTGGKEELAWQR